MSINAAVAYQNNRVKTAAPADLTLMLYDGAIKFCNIALAGIEENDFEKVNLNILKTEKIVDYLKTTLDFRYPVAKDFENVYNYIFDRLVYANIKKDKETLIEVLGHLREMRDTWREVMKQSK